MNFSQAYEWGTADQRAELLAEPRPLFKASFKMYFLCLWPGLFACLYNFFSMTPFVTVFLGHPSAFLTQRFSTLTAGRHCTQICYRDTDSRRNRSQAAARKRPSYMDWVRNSGNNF